METITGAVDFSGLKIKIPESENKQKHICFSDKYAIFHAVFFSEDDAVFLIAGDTVYICSEALVIVYRPGSLILKTGNDGLYYTFIGSCLIFSTDHIFLQLFDSENKNTGFISPECYGKFSKNGLSVY